MKEGKVHPKQTRNARVLRCVGAAWGAILLAQPAPAHATEYFRHGFEGQACDQDIVNPPFWSGTLPGQVRCDTPAEGANYGRFDTSQGQIDIYTEVNVDDVTGLPGRTFFLCHFERFDRVGGADIWHDSDDTDSADKGVELEGSGLRWVTSRGRWGAFSVPNQDHHWTVWLGNPSHHLNHDVPGCPVLETYDILLPNAGGYDVGNPIQLEYERWYAIVMEVTMNTFAGVEPQPDGAARLWVNGALHTDYDGICTLAEPSGAIDRLTINGTLAQPAYDAPPHLRKFDGFLLTDDWTDVEHAGCLSDPEGTLPDGGTQDPGAGGSGAGGGAGTGGSSEAGRGGADTGGSAGTPDSGVGGVSATPMAQEDEGGCGCRVERGLRPSWRRAALLLSFLVGT